MNNYTVAGRVLRCIGLETDACFAEDESPSIRPLEIWSGPCVLNRGRAGTFNASTSELMLVQIINALPRKEFGFV